MALHPNAVRSPSKDLEVLGVAANDVLEITNGLNQGSYVIRDVDGHIAFLQQSLPFEDPGPVSAVIRKNRERAATLTAAVVIDQPLYDGGVSKYIVMDMLIA